MVWTERDGRGCLDFAALQRRVVSGTRAAALAADEPASYMAFDVIARKRRDVRRHPLDQRRGMLEDLAMGFRPPLHLTPQTTRPEVAQQWLEDYRSAQVGVKGIVVKDRRAPYLPGKRRWHKLRIRNTAEAIIGAVTGPLDEPTHLVLALPRSRGGCWSPARRPR